MSLHHHDFVIIWYILLIKSIVKTPLPWVTTVTFKYKGSLDTRFSFQFQFRTDVQEILVTNWPLTTRENLQEIENDNEIWTWENLKTMKGFEMLRKWNFQSTYSNHWRKIDAKVNTPDFDDVNDVSFQGGEDLESVAWQNLITWSA